MIKKLIDNLHYLARNILKEDGVSLSQYYALHLIKNSARARMKDVKNSLCVSGAYATSIIDKLVKKELIERYRDQEDRRVVMVKLTKEGEKLIKILDRKKVRFYTSLSSNMNEKDKNTMNKGLSLLTSSLDRVLKNIK